MSCRTWVGRRRGRDTRDYRSRPQSDSHDGMEARSLPWESHSHLCHWHRLMLTSPLSTTTTYFYSSSPVNTTSQLTSESALGPVSRQSVYLAVGCYYSLPGLWLPTWPHSITCLWTAANDAAWWYRLTYMSSLPRTTDNSVVHENQTRDLLNYIRHCGKI